MKNLFIVFLFFAASGCATVFSGTTTKVNVSGYPESAEVYYNGNYEGTSPCNVKVAKSDLKKGAEIVVKQNGFESNGVKLVRKTKAGAIVGDILFTGGLGLIVDFATNAAYKPHPKQIKYNLSKQEK